MIFFIYVYYRLLMKIQFPAKSLGNQRISYCLYFKRIRYDANEEDIRLTITNISYNLLILSKTDFSCIVYIIFILNTTRQSSKSFLLNAWILY